MLLVGKCKKCEHEVRLDIDNKTVDEVIGLLEKMDSFQCPGHHVELSSPYPNYWYVNGWAFEEGKADTGEEFLQKLKDSYTEVMDTNEMTHRNIITGFAYGFPITSDGHYWNFVHSPRGKRYYYR